jgi:hypothetical protein
MSVVASTRSGLLALSADRLILRKNIQKYVGEHDDRDCGDRYPTSDTVKSWLRRPAPVPREWKGPAKMETVKPGLFDLKRWEQITRLTGAALIAYLVISEGSRLFPAPNLVPVP